MDHVDSDKTWVIQGVSQSGEPIRPSDWAERMCGNLSTFHNQRIHYSPLLQPIMVEGQKCVRVDPQLKETHPDLYEGILEFIRVNQLQICTPLDN